jgi:transposase-like protein
VSYCEPERMFGQAGAGLHVRGTVSRGCDNYARNRALRRRRRLRGIDSPDECWATACVVELSGLLSNPRLASTLDAIWEQLKKQAPVDSRQRAETSRQPRRRQRRLTPSEAENLVTTYQERAITIEDLAAHFGIHRQTAARHLELAGITIRRKILDETQVAEAIRLYATGWSLARIGHRLGVASTTVNYRLRQAGVELRSRPGRA